MKPTTALIISTYNWPGALELCLKSVTDQTILPDEIIIADDGSGSGTFEVVKKFQTFFPKPVKHVWHKDLGFRLAEIRNRAIAESVSDYIVFIDGDIILNRHFIEDHIYFRRKGHFITGSRILIGNQLTSLILNGSAFHFRFFSRQFKNSFNIIRFKPLATLFLQYSTRFLDVRGCNLSFWKSDLLFVDGFDQQYTGWGREDSDIVVRLINAGRKRIKLKFAALQYHLYHVQHSRESIVRNDNYLKEAEAQKRITAIEGISKL